MLKLTLSKKHRLQKAGHGQYNIQGALHQTLWLIDRWFLSNKYNLIQKQFNKTIDNILQNLKNNAAIILQFLNLVFVTSPEND